MKIELTDELREEINEISGQKYRKYFYSARGQTINPEDNFEWWLMHETWNKCCEMMINNYYSNKNKSTNGERK